MSLPDSGALLCSPAVLVLGRLYKVADSSTQEELLFCSRYLGQSFSAPNKTDFESCNLSKFRPQDELVVVGHSPDRIQTNVV